MHRQQEERIGDNEQQREEMQCTGNLQVVTVEMHINDLAHLPLHVPHSGCSNSAETNIVF